MKESHGHSVNQSADIVPAQSRTAWEIWKILADFSDMLWDVYYEDFMALAASEVAPEEQCGSRTDLQI